MRNFLLILSVWGVHLAFISGNTLGALVAGDIAIIGVNTTASDQFAWFPLVSLSAGETITFTDSGWRNNSTFLGGEGAIRYTAPMGGVAAGTVLTFTGIGGAYSSAGDAVVGVGSLDLSINGDQLFAFSGTSANPTFLFAVQTNSNVYQSDATNGNTSALPAGLTVGTTALAVGVGSGPTDEVDNTRYESSTILGTREELLLSIADAANWSGSATPFSSPSNNVSSFTVTAVPEPAAYAYGALICALLGVSYSGAKLRKKHFPR